MKRKLILAILIFVLIGCAPTRKEFICIVDVNRDSNCRIIPCSEISEICKAGKYRILKNYVTGYAYVYSVDPLTDLNRCKESAKGGTK